MLPDITYQFLLPTLLFFKNLCNSYGWAIILTTLLIRLLLWPLVAGSTRSMQRMSQLQPKLKALQEKYKDDPAEFQKKAMEFYQKNKINPAGGCLPTLVQLPILIALYATFMGPPFTDKAIPVKITLAKPADAATVKVVSNPTSGATAPYVSPDGQLAKFAVQPGDQTMVWGTNGNGPATNSPNVIDFHVTPVSGNAPANFTPEWKIQSDSNGATIETERGMASFPAEGDITVEADLPGGAQPIQVPIHVGPKKDAGGGLPFGIGGGGDPFLSKQAQSATTSTVTVDGKTVTVAVTPGESSVSAGSKNVPFQLRALNGGSTEGINVAWHIVKDPNAATLDPKTGRVVFPKPGEVTVAAMIPGEAKNHSFYFISSLGKVANGPQMFKPQNFDVLAMVIAFAVTMWLSQKLMVQPTTNMDPEQAAIQKQTQQMMPIMLSAMFVFYPLPAGVFIYLVVSNVMQTLQTWLIYKSPAPALIDVTEGTLSNGSAKGNGGIIDIEATSSDVPAGTTDLDSKRSKKKKKKDESSKDFGQQDKEEDEK